MGSMPAAISAGLLWLLCACQLVCSSSAKGSSPASSLVESREYRMTWAALKQRLQPGGSRPPQLSSPRLQLLNSDLAQSTGALGGARSSYAAICSIVRDQHSHVMEWVAYHQSIGFHQIYLFDDGSMPPLQTVLEDYIAMGVVKVFYVRESTNPLKDKTMAMYESCLQLFSHRHTFITFLDVDEFFVLKDGSRNATALLEEFEGEAGLAINWLTFGSSGRLFRAKSGVLQNYVACVPRGENWNKHVRFAVNTRYALRPKDAHTWAFRGNASGLTTSGYQTVGPYGDMDYSRVAIHHYVTKSAEEFAAKLIRGAAHGQKPPEDLLEKVDRHATQACTDAVPIGEQIAQTVLGF